MAFNAHMLMEGIPVQRVCHRHTGVHCTAIQNDIKKVAAGRFHSYELHLELQHTAGDATITLVLGVQHCLLRIPSRLAFQA